VQRGLSEVAAPTSIRTAATDALAKLSETWILRASPEGAAHAAGLVASAVESLASEAASLIDDADTRAVAALSRTTAMALETTDSEAERLAKAKRYAVARKAEIAPGVLAALDAKKDLAGLHRELRGVLEHISTLPGIEKPLPGLITKPPLAPDPSDGVFCAGVGGRLSIAQNRLASALVGASVLASTAHVAAETPAAGSIAVEVVRNEIRECGAGALDVVLADPAAIVLAHNHITACADLVATETAAGHNHAPEPASSAGQAVMRAVGSGDLFVLDNLLYGNGHAGEGALLHEIYLDFRGDIVVRGNVVRHTGGGAGGAGLMLAVEPVSATLLKRLSRQSALEVDRPPARKTSVPPLFFLPWRPLAEVETFLPVAVATSAYAARSATASRSTLLGHLQRRAPLELRNWIRPARRAVHVEGNRINAAGPALLVVGEGSAIVSTTVVGNELRSQRPTGAAYLRHTDATVFSSNHCECARSVNVVVIRPDSAPVSVTGNVVLGAQPARQGARVLERQSEIASKLVAKEATTIDTSYIKALELREMPIARNFLDVSEHDANYLRDIAARPLATPATRTPSRKTPVQAAPQPTSHSLVVLGGTNIASVGNATTAGTLVVDAADHTTLDR